MQSCRLLVPLVFFITPAALLSQALQEPPTFRSGVRAIEVDVRVTDARGHAVKELTKDDFELHEDGLPQRITGVSFYGPLGSLAPGPAADPVVATNAGDGQMYTMFASTVRRAGAVARQFVDEVIGPNDQMAIIDPLRSSNPELSFARNRAAMLAEIDRVTSLSDRNIRARGGSDETTR